MTPPGWWLDLAMPAVTKDVAVREGGQDALAKLLAKGIGRRPLWDHAPVSRFIATGTATLEFAQAVSEFFGLPSPVFLPRDIHEGMEMLKVKAKYDAIIARRDGSANAPASVLPMHGNAGDADDADVEPATAKRQRRARSA